MKKCGKCKTYLEDEDFSFRKGRLQSFCKNCQKECSKKYREKNKKSCRKNLKEWREENKSDRKLDSQQILQEEFRSKMRRMLKRKNDKIEDSILKYSSEELKSFLIKTFGTLPKEGIVLSYKKPLKEFNLSFQEEWRKAGSFENLILKFKET
jgi:CRISPR/Cas system CMR subunit Cmr6 (Cas7 group RAMP superfamily)